MSYSTGLTSCLRNVRDDKTMTSAQSQSGLSGTSIRVSAPKNALHSLSSRAAKWPVSGCSSQ